MWVEGTGGVDIKLYDGSQCKYPININTNTKTNTNPYRDFYKDVPTTFENDNKYLKICPFSNNTKISNIKCPGMDLLNDSDNNGCNVLERYTNGGTCTFTATTGDKVENITFSDFGSITDRKITGATNYFIRDPSRYSSGRKPMYLVIGEPIAPSQGRYYYPPNICSNLNIQVNPSNRYILPSDRVNSTILTVPDKYLNKPSTRFLSKYKTSSEIPDNFSWRTLRQLMPPLDQGICGCCWACASVSALADRYAVKYSIQQAPELSLFWVTNNITYKDVYYENVPIDTHPYKCNGRNPTEALEFIEENNIKLNKCWPMFDLNDSAKIDFPLPVLYNLSDDCCLNCCNSPDNFSFTIEKNSIEYLSKLNTLEKLFTSYETITKNVQNEIMNTGPVVACFDVYNDFEMYWRAMEDFSDDLIYRKDDQDLLNYLNKKYPDVMNDFENDKAGGHAVVITGWGEKNNIRYWEIKNSWGAKGLCQGYGKIAFSIDTPSNNWVGLDIQNVNGGGVYTFLPGTIPLNYLNKNIINSSIINCDTIYDKIDPSIKYDLLIYVSPALGSSIKLTYGNLNYNKTLDNIQVYAIDEDNSWYGPVVDVTVWDKTNPNTKFAYNIQQNFWTAFYPNPPLTIKSGT